MKLLFCLHCHDIVRLYPERRSCKCGRSWGQYTEDLRTTIQTSNSLSIGLANPDFIQAVETFMDRRDHFSPVLSIRAWLNPDSEPDVQYVEEEPSPPATSDQQPVSSNQLPAPATRTP